ncbi:MAG: HypC/HybG/HupF family hydrogenase formation chaperone [Vicinamibacteria bacterium]|jgi:hydrogenase expression/formation protein HypC|nr:HypC/HybG/HupF family hydrogenase formation chaperone [Vicinamibacteria bacterium]
MCLAVPGEIVEIVGADLARAGKVSFGGVLKDVSLACVPEATVGDFVLVHVGLAIQTVDAEEARKTLAYLRDIDELARADAAPGRSN